jgi:hypothetical protein
MTLNACAGSSLCLCPRVRGETPLKRNLTSCRVRAKDLLVHADVERHAARREHRRLHQDDQHVAHLAIGILRQEDCDGRRFPYSEQVDGVDGKAISRRRLSSEPLAASGDLTP